MAASCRPPSVLHEKPAVLLRRLPVPDSGSRAVRRDSGPTDDRCQIVCVDGLRQWRADRGVEGGREGRTGRTHQRERKSGVRGKGGTGGVDIEGGGDNEKT